MSVRSTRNWAVIARLVSFSRTVSRTVAVAISLRIVNQGIGIGLLGFSGAVVGALIRPYLGAGHLPEAAALPVPTDALPAIAVLAGASVVKAVARYLEQYTGHWAAFKVLGLLRNAVYDHLQAHAARVAATERTGDLVSRVMADVDRTEVFFAHTLAPAVAAFVLGLGTALVMALAVGLVPAGVLAVGLVAVAVGWPAIIAHRSARDARESRAVLGELNATVVDVVLGIREILTYRIDARERIDEPSVRYDTVQRRRARIAGGGDAAIDFTIAATLVAVVVVSPAAMLPFAVALAAGAFGPALAFALVYADAGPTIEAARRVFRVFDEYPASAEPTAKPATTPAPKPTTSPASGEGAPGFAFGHVWFAYPGGRSDGHTVWVHHGLSFSVDPGKLTVVIGPSGCGKSTIVPLILGWYAPQRGRIEWGPGGRPPLDRIGVMPQRSFVLRGSLRENLVLAKPDATDAELLRACDAAALTAWLASLPNGLDTELGVAESTVSGGERRRIALARLVLRNAALEIYDEPTAHLDPENARVVHRRIANSNATRIVITHDPALVKHADRVFHVRDGAAVDGVPAALIVERGSQWP